MDDTRVEQEQTKSDNKIGLIIISILCGLSLIVSVYSMNENAKLRNEMEATSTENVVSTSANVKTEESEFATKEQYDALKDKVDILDLQHQMENGGVVTDNFVIDKIRIYNFKWMPEDSKMEELTMRIDLEGQPSMNSKYKGNGLFDLPDRELKIYITEVLDIVKSQWENHNFFIPVEDQNKFEDGEHAITYRNYEVATYKDGVLKLKGE
jgi:hypothetical protein